jgi:Flavin containing amine oxidoreductase
VVTTHSRTNSNSTTYKGDAVLITLPLGVLKESLRSNGVNNITFSPPLPDWKTAAIHRLGFGNLNKVGSLVCVYVRVCACVRVYKCQVHWNVVVCFIPVCCSTNCRQAGAWAIRLNSLNAAIRLAEREHSNALYVYWALCMLLRQRNLTV